MNLRVIITFLSIALIYVENVTKFSASRTVTSQVRLLSQID